VTRAWIEFWSHVSTLMFASEVSILRSGWPEIEYVFDHSSACRSGADASIAPSINHPKHFISPPIAANGISPRGLGRIYADNVTPVPSNPALQCLHARRWPKTAEPEATL